MFQIINEFVALLPNEDYNLDEVMQFEVGNIKIEDLGYTENEIKAKQYLESLSYEDLYLILSAWDIGRSSLTYPESLNEEIKDFGGKENLFNENIKILKTNIPVKDEAISYIMGKQGAWVKECLNAFKKLYINS
ncbi:hypothetical protein FEZ53_01715 [Staphylococcus xylosus]|uniref:Uncharacterized protein n=1 Tax=Staphylococcus xylosus TaxID=1288 RepID=A0A5R9B3P6_STAXY|nr:hypothetical protein [Staphylococcus xylosus]MEB6297570.1 hypothetical protein [Staphylococcus xylosus]TLP91010.1 hypothetical protein FEZ53_01715 [Staphylococcus xylosus]